MAKQVRANTAVTALGSLLNAIGTVAADELKDNPEALAEVKAMVATVKDSNYVTAAEMLDDNIVTMHRMDEVFDGAGLDRVQMERQTAIDGARATVRAALPPAYDDDYNAIVRDINDDDSDRADDLDLEAM